MTCAGIACYDEELSVLEKRFTDINGFDYLEFLKALIDMNKIKKCSVSK